MSPSKNGKYGTGSSGAASTSARMSGPGLLPTCAKPIAVVPLGEVLRPLPPGGQRRHQRLVALEERK